MRTRLIVVPHDEVMQTAAMFPRSERVGVVLINAKHKEKLVQEVEKCCDWLLFWQTGDYDIPSLHESVSGYLLSHLKNLLSIVEGAEPSTLENMALFIYEFDKRMEAEHRLVNNGVFNLVVSCRMGLSRSPAVAIWAAERLGELEQAKMLKTVFDKTYNRYIYGLLRSVGRIVAAVRYQHGEARHVPVGIAKVGDELVKALGVLSRMQEATHVRNERGKEQDEERDKDMGSSLRLHS